MLALPPQNTQATLTCLAGQIRAPPCFTRLVLTYRNKQGIYYFHKASLLLCTSQWCFDLAVSHSSLVKQGGMSFYSQADIAHSVL